MNRLARTALMLLTLGTPLAACSNFDPSDLIDAEWLNPKKPLQGERKELFPQGTPGVPQGVPQDLYRGYQAPASETASAPPVQPGSQTSLASVSARAAPGHSPDAPTEEPQAKPKPKPKPKVAAVPAQPKSTPTAVTVRPGGDSSNGSNGASSPWPDPPQTKQGGASSGGNQQGIWPDPPAPGTYAH